eukprot:276354-Amphidinium_carterae.1
MLIFQYLRHFDLRLSIANGFWGSDCQHLRTVRSKLPQNNINIKILKTLAGSDINCTVSSRFVRTVWQTECASSRSSWSNSREVDVLIAT